MTPERWARFAELFDRAAECPITERAALLAAACPDDPALREEVVRMLESDAKAGLFGESPAFRFDTVSSGSASPRHASLELGSHLGRYRIVGLLGAGGMGEVYRARDPQLDREVAIKVLAPRDGISADQLSRFGREARAVAALNHSNILTVYDLGLERGIPYVVSELLDGETLRARLERGPLAVDRAMAMALQIATGLAAAHDRGIVHRDLKPENLFITSDGIIKILDFGLAKQTARAGGPAATQTDSGFVIGTAAYMAPEQVRGEPANVRSDLFSFGAVLYEMLTGTRAFVGGSAVETMHAVLARDPDPIDSAPAAVAGIVERCLEKDPSRRFPSARDLAAALAAECSNEECRSEPPGPASAGRAGPPKAGHDVRTRAAFAAGVILVAAIGAMSFMRRDEPPPSPGVTGRPALAVVPFDDRSGDPEAAWLSTGIPNMLVTSLAQTPGLDVIGTDRLEAVFNELGRPPSDRSARAEAARRTGAGALLVGTVFKAGPELRLDVQLHDVATGRVVVARNERGADLFGLVDTIAGHVRTALDVTAAATGRPLRDVTTASLAAYELYTKAQQARHNNRMSDARTLIEEALRLDPMFTLARAQLVTLLERLGENAAASAERVVVRSQLDRLPERQRLLAEAVQEYDANPARALELLERLLERYPDEEEAYDAIVHAYTHARDPAYWKKALTFMQRWARAIPGPGSGHFHNHYGYAYIEHGLFTEAEREFRAYIRVSPDEANGYDSLAELFVITGRPATAIEHYDQALKRNPMFGWSHFGRAYAFAMQGQYEATFAAMRTLRSLGARGDAPAAVVEMVEGLFNARVGRYDDAVGRFDAARRIARSLGDVGAAADVELFDAMVALERGQYQRALDRADRAVTDGARTALDIMRARRAAVAHLFAGIADARAGRTAAASRRLSAQRAMDTSRDPLQVSWQHGLSGEIALTERRLHEAEKEFLAAEYPLASSFAIYPALVALGNNLPFRDGLARVAVAKGDRAGAIEMYRRLNQPDVTSKWTAVFDPRYAALAAQLAR